MIVIIWLNATPTNIPATINSVIFPGEHSIDGGCVVDNCVLLLFRKMVGTMVGIFEGQLDGT